MRRRGLLRRTFLSISIIDDSAFVRVWKQAATGSPMRRYAEALFANVLNSGDLFAKGFCNLRSAGDRDTCMKI